MNRNLLKVSHPRGFVNERNWIFEILLKDFLGINYSLEATDRLDVQLTYNNRSLTIRDSFFQMPESAWLAERSLPSSPCTYWSTDSIDLNITLTNKDVPVIFGEPNCMVSSAKIELQLDIFGSAFFMLSRYEEVVLSARDRYDRFPSQASFSHQNNFLERPVVNEYLEILWSFIKHLWPDIQRKPRQYRNIITCDVDTPYQRGTKNLLRQVGHIGTDIAVQKDFRKAGKSLLNYFASKKGNYQFDPYYTALNWIIDVNEAVGNSVTFNFMAGISEPKLDVCYTMKEINIRALMRKIFERGHEIGLHPSFNTYLDELQLKTEADT
jgi:hypothetical protein